MSARELNLQVKAKTPLKSKIVSKKAVKWGKILRVEKLYSNETLVENFVSTLKSNKPDITDEEVEKEKRRMIMRDNLFNLAMDEVSSAYNVEFNEEELNERVSEFKRIYTGFTEEQVQNNAKVSIFKQLIYEDLARDWELEVTDEVARNVLENFYKQTGKSVREYLTDPEKLEAVKDSVLEQLITERIMNAFGSQFALDEVSHGAKS